MSDRKIGQGGTITLEGDYRDGAQIAVDPTSPFVDIIDPNDIEVVTNAVPTRIALGQYTYDYVVAVDAALGMWKAHWTGIINGVLVAGEDFFEVVVAGTVGSSTLWVTVQRVGVLLQTDLSTDPNIEELILHAQELAEVVIGVQANPNNRIRAILANIVARMWQAGQSARANPAAMQSETAGPFNFQNVNAGVAGLGLTDREKAALRQAAGMFGLAIQPTSRGDELETAPAVRRLDADTLDPIEVLASAQTGVRR